MTNVHWRKLDQRRIDNKLSFMYKITHNLIAILISDFLIPLVRSSRHYHPLSYRLITATTDYYKCSFFSKSCISLEQPPPRNGGLLHLGAVQPSSLQDWPRLTIEITILFLLNLTCILTYFILSRCILITIVWWAYVYWYYAFVDITMKMKSMSKWLYIQGWSKMKLSPPLRPVPTHMFH